MAEVVESIDPPLHTRLWRLMQGNPSAPRDYRLTRWLFLRALGLIHFVAFLSLSVQMLGLAGSEGILPAEETLAAVTNHFGGTAWWHLPTLGWLSASDFALQCYGYLGMLFAALLVAGVVPRLTIFLCWLLYLSLYHLGGNFLSFQWDILLLETTLLAWFLAPRVWLENPFEDPPVSRIALWLPRLLLWKLMFFSGWVKLPDDTWTQLNALLYHYETQPLPHAVSWFAHQFPLWFQQTSVAIMFFIELVAPWFLFCPRRVRVLGAAFFALLMALIISTGNYTYFNLLTLALCVLWLDDDALLGAMPLRMRIWYRDRACVSTTPRRLAYLPSVAAAAWLFLFSLQTTALFVGYAALGEFRSLLAAVQPWHVCNSYGLFRSMTTERYEIEIEGSQDRIHWEPYLFTYKPGDPTRMPRWCQPHQPRLDWQMWFAALSNAQQTPWFQRLVVQLLRGSKPVEALFEEVPFPDVPPKYIRALYYQYRFTTWKDGNADEGWWTRELRGEYLQPVSLR